MVTILVADDHHIVRSGLCLLLSQVSDFEVVGEASNQWEILLKLRRLKPDILILDVEMGDNTLYCMSAITQASPATRVVVLSMHDNEIFVLDALRQGARAYVLKKAPSDEVERAIRAVMMGQHYLSAPLSRQVIEKYIDRANSEQLDLYESLTTRQREVLYYTVNDYTEAQIAERLGIATSTVSGHLYDAMQRLQLKDRSELVRYALQRGLVMLNSSSPTAAAPPISFTGITTDSGWYFSTDVAEVSDCGEQQEDYPPGGMPSSGG